MEPSPSVHLFSLRFVSVVRVSNYFWKIIEIEQWYPWSSRGNPDTTYFGSFTSKRPHITMLLANQTRRMKWWHSVLKFQWNNVRPNEWELRISTWVSNFKVQIGFFDATKNDFDCLPRFKVRVCLAPTTTCVLAWKRKSCDTTTTETATVTAVIP